VIDPERYLVIVDPDAAGSGEGERANVYLVGPFEDLALRDDFAARHAAWAQRHVQLVGGYPEWNEPLSELLGSASAPAEDEWAFDAEEP
jgi:hypothetical protein